MSRHPKLPHAHRAPPWRRWAVALLLGLGLGFGAAAAATEAPLPAFLQRQWSAWLIEAYDQPDEVKASLMAIPVESQQASWHRFARARLAMLRGDWAEAQALYPEAPGAKSDAAVLVVHALLDDGRMDVLAAVPSHRNVVLDCQCVPHGGLSSRGRGRWAAARSRLRAAAAQPQLQVAVASNW